ncbi:unnamed protein product, partial [marine sediment metagenome]
MVMNKKKLNIIILTVILIGMIALIPSPLLDIINVNNDSKIDDNLIDNDINTKNPTLSKYISTYNDSGGVFNVTLHQSLINNTIVRITNTSDTDNITFYEKCPTDTNFNSSFINITIEDIFAPNKTLVIEDQIPQDSASSLAGVAYLTSFNVNKDCFLTNGSFYMYIENSPTVRVYLYNSS